MLIAAEQSETIEKARLLIANSCRQGFYGEVVVKIEDGVIERIYCGNGAKKPFDLKIFGIGDEEIRNLAV